jgi:hypothetical protein
MGSLCRLATALGGAGALFFIGGASHAESIIKNPGDHPNYKVEIEPQAALGWGHLYHGNGFGVGARFSIPIVDVGFVKSINDSVAISFGFDWLRYGDCYYYENRGNRRLGYGCGASYFVFPVAMQWNFWLSPNWSVFAEPGLYLFHGVYDDYCDVRFVNCVQPTKTSVDLAFFAGGRFHFNETIALTMRLGYPTSSFGVSFLF